MGTDTTITQPRGSDVVLVILGRQSSREGDSAADGGRTEGTAVRVWGRTRGLTFNPSYFSGKLRSI